MSPDEAATVPTLTIAARDFLYIAPEILLTAWGLLVLLTDIALLRRLNAPARRRSVGGLALLGAVLGLGLIYLDLPTWTGLAYSDPDPLIFFGTIAGDVATSRLNVVILCLLALVVGLSLAWDFTEHWGEYFALLFWAAVGMMLLVASDELLTLFLTLELMTLCLYLATAFEKGRRRSPEGALKYFVYGSVSSALFLFGLSLIYGLTGTTRLDVIQQVFAQGRIAAEGLAGNAAGMTATLLVLAGFGFKVAAVPFHQWAPDAYEGAPAPVSAWIASGSKLASFAAMLKVLSWGLGPWALRGAEMSSPGWVGVLAVIAAVSMTYGNLAALAQRNFKRLLAYSSIAHAGYILVGVVAVSARPLNQEAAGAVLFYTVIYAFTNVGAFALAAWLARDRTTDDIDDLNGLAAESPALAACVLVLMLSLIGMPPLAGFFGKLYLFLEALKASEPGQFGLTWLVALGLANTVLSAFYYVRVLKAMYLRNPGRAPMREATASISLPIVLSTLVVVGFGVLPAPLLETMKGASLPLLSRSATVRSEVLGPSPLQVGPDATAPTRPDSPPAPPPAVPGPDSARGAWRLSDSSPARR